MSSISCSRSDSASTSEVKPQTEIKKEIPQPQTKKTFLRDPFTITLETFPFQENGDYVHPHLILNKSDRNNYYWAVQQNPVKTKRQIESIKIPVGTVLFQCKPLIVGQGQLCLLRSRTSQGFYQTVVELIGKSFRPMNPFKFNSFAFDPIQMKKSLEFLDKMKHHLKFYEQLYPRKSLQEEIERKKVKQEFGDMFGLSLPSMGRGMGTKIDDPKTTLPVSSKLLQELHSTKAQSFATQHPELAEKLSKNVFWASAMQFLIYKDPSFLNHSCVPNCSWFINPTNGSILIRNTRTLLPNEEITISYQSLRFLSSEHRETFLQETCHFHCTCFVCSPGVTQNEIHSHLLTWNLLEEMRLQHAIPPYIPQTELDKRKAQFLRLIAKLPEKEKQNIKQSKPLELLLMEEKTLMNSRPNGETGKEKEIKQQKAKEQTEKWKHWYYPLYCSFCGKAPEVDVRGKKTSLNTSGDGVAVKPKLLNPKNKKQKRKQKKQKNFELNKGVSLKICQGCQAVSFCSEGCKLAADHVPVVCETYKIYLGASGVVSF